ncbi:MAG: TIGR03085 family protein [Actinomycetales bacterium]|nr:TIGR03085 family protein [Actinomycetales bacterium]
MWWNQQEQDALTKSLRDAGPDASTLCEGWRTRHLAAHLYLRGHEPWRLAGMVVPWARDGLEELVQRTGDEAREPEAYAELLDRFTAPPTGANPMRLFSQRATEAANLVEYVIHHEDVRRAGDDPSSPRELPAAMQDAIWAQSARMASLGYRSCPVGVVLVVPDGPRRVVRKGSTSVAVTGAPVELALFGAGRREQARVRITGDPEAVAAFEAFAQT